MKTCKDFIEKNKNKPNTKLWIFGRDLDSYYGTPNYKYIKEILNSNDLKYDYKLKEDIYLFEIQKSAFFVKSIKFKKNVLKIRVDAQKKMTNLSFFLCNFS